jgi:soluble lytic murein transglycosylase-like protein
MLGNSLRLGCIIFSILWANSLEARFYPQSASLTAIATKTNTVASTTETTAADVWFDDLVYINKSQGLATAHQPRLNPQLNPQLKPQLKSQLKSEFVYQEGTQPQAIVRLKFPEANAQANTGATNVGTNAGGNTNPIKPIIVARYSSQGTAKSLQGEDKVFHYKNNTGGAVFSDRAPAGISYQILLFDCFACQLNSNLDWHKIPLFDLAYDVTVMRAAREFRLDPALIRAVIHAESAFDAGARSKAGAMGLMQLMPGTAMDMQVDNAFNPQQNIRGGSRYLAKMLKQFNGDIDLACAAYNAGPSVVTQYQGIPPYPETKAYVKRVKILLQRYRAALES